MNSGQTESNRIHWIDTAKCIGIFLIVLGHALRQGEALRYIYTFHVPLFFFLTGCVFSIGNKKFIPYVLSRLKMLMLPYIVFGLISILIYYVLGNVAADSLGIQSESKGLLTDIINIISGTCYANRPLWFLPCMFVISVVAFLLMKLKETFKSNKVKILFLFFIILFSIMVHCLYIHFDLPKLFWRAEIALFMLSFFFGGVLLRETGLLSKLPELKLWQKLLVFIVLAFIGGVIGMQNSASVNVYSFVYGNLFIFYASSILSILAVCFLCMSIPPNKITGYIGQNTLSVLLMHKFPILFFQTVLSITVPFMKEASLLPCIAVSLISMFLCLAAGKLIELILPELIGKKRKILPEKTK